MNLNNAILYISAASSAQFPKDKLPEVAMLGRSNVGKSSFINCLLNRNKFARTSSVPGKTALINFYEIDKKLYLADLPGYGYAQVSKSEKDRWSKLIESYLSEKDRIALYILLVDLRHSPSKDDIIMCDWLKHFDVPFAVVATKADKVSKSKQEEQAKMIEEELEIDDLIIFSAIDKTGRDKILKILTRISEGKHEIRES